ncbi:hypothetical protein GUJ93_ZPchr0004g39285 [Zizania palustris]|uniref:Uncharacterized protein n=1 Tax=Zizania palustris TaxID=103762 RepID=A0A8J5S134_ZIZPA|nr:hypothetical protein GUJ93_ZPchr0004g39285 [Zizania palustris]
MTNVGVPFPPNMHLGEFGFIPDSQLHSTVNASESVLEIHFPKPSKGHRGKKVSQRDKAFSKEEDRIICSAFLNVSKDPVIVGAITKGCMTTLMRTLVPL